MSNTRATILMACLLAAGCSDPLARVDRLSDVEVEETAAPKEIVADAEDEPPRGIFATLFGRGRTAPDSDQSEDAREQREAVADAVEDPGTASSEATSSAPVPETETQPAPQAEPDQPVADASPRPRGFLGLFRRQSNPEPDPATDRNVTETTASEDTAPEGGVTVASGNAAAVVADADQAAEPQQVSDTALPETGPPADGEEVQVAAAGATGGLLGLFRRGPGNGSKSRTPRKSTGPDARDLTEGERVAFGEVARLCNVRATKLGKEVAKYPERGARYRIYDSVPNSTAPRSFYISGFKDGCLRQFTGALAIFGSPVMHEQLRYGLPAKQQPYSETDKGYELIKTKICSVSAKKPCGKRMSRLEKDTAFISYYERFGGAARWANILLHNGTVVAADIKTK